MWPAEPKAAAPPSQEQKNTEAEGQQPTLQLPADLGNLPSGPAGSDAATSQECILEHARPAEGPADAISAGRSGISRDTAPQTPPHDVAPDAAAATGTAEAATGAAAGAPAHA